MAISKNKAAVLDHYLTDTQLEYFRTVLKTWRAETIRSAKKANFAIEDSGNEPDVMDSVSNLANQAVELQLKNKIRTLLHQIDEALERIDNGTYGYCEETGEEIGFNRLQAIPVTTLCLEAQTRLEKRQKLLKEHN